MSREKIPEKTFESERIYSGRIIKLRKDIVILPNGRNADREIVDHPGAVVILAEKEQQKIILVKQFRKAVEEFLLELPAGTIEPSEKIIDCARRELEEETGYLANKWQKIFEFFSAPGFCSEKLTLYFARDLIQTKSNTDQDEFIEIIEVNKVEISKLIKNKRIRDAKSLVGILWWLNK
ncbi:MAG: NUDIX hydrolase [Atribacterota bacterium]|jgi:ADP-ribose pyrophosphatase|nr:NUDIX hydrolase [Atribacterota bacterium]MDD4895519.1 NUDIX hydrolase [Atribacterota bacterium]MDD5637709.1 NUDIX hydrolase [Atribacterota bacterium]